MKISKLLPIALAFTLCTSLAAFAEDPIAATATYTLQLPEYLKITASDPGSAGVTSYDDGYTGVNLDKALAGTFTVITNNPDKVVYLQGSATTTSGAVNALFSEDDADAKKLVLVFANKTANHIPTSDDISNITAGTAAVASNSNAIAFRLSPSGMTNDILSTTATGTWDSTKKQVSYAIDNGTTNFTYTLAQTAYDNTFSTHDTMGDYVATLTMTDTSL